MTTSTASEVERRRGGVTARPRTLSAGLSSALLARSLELGAGRESEIRWPSPRYQADPVAFFREILGVEPWAKQVEICEAVRDHRRVAVSSGHKCGKSATDAGIALWFYCSFPSARVVMSSVTSRQVDQILWREVRMMRAKAKHPIDGDMHELARSGLKAADFREIVGFTAKEAEAVAGISGPNLLYILDEASGIEEAIFEAIEGNRAGGARVLLTSNPTRNEGEFYAAFHEKSRFYRTIRMSSEDVPNVREGRMVIPGLATREWIDEKREEWGADSPLYSVRVRGEFVTRDEGRIISLHTIQQAEARWHETPDEGRLFVGLDPAGDSADERNDESVFAARRGSKVLGLYPFRGLTAEAHVFHLLDVIGKHRRPREPDPVVLVDREGKVGAEVYGALRARAELLRRGQGYELIGVRGGNMAGRGLHNVERIRDELWWHLERWLRGGGAVPEDAKLAKELHAPEWYTHENSGLTKVSSKRVLRKLLGRSPDRADAVALAVYDMAAREYEIAEIRESDRWAASDDEVRAPSLDPYAGAAAWGGR